jgi:hypothetical protein
MYSEQPSCPSRAIAFCFMYSVRKAPMLVLSAARASEGSVDSERVFEFLVFLVVVGG